MEELTRDELLNDDRYITILHEDAIENIGDYLTAILTEVYLSPEEKNEYNEIFSRVGNITLRQCKDAYHNFINLTPDQIREKLITKPYGISILMDTTGGADIHIDCSIKSNYRYYEMLKFEESKLGLFTRITNALKNKK